MAGENNRPNNPRLFFIPEELVQLNREVRTHHPLLVKYIENTDLSEALAGLAAETNMIVDGMFDDAGLSALAEKIRQRLVARRRINPTLILQS